MKKTLKINMVSQGMRTYFDLRAPACLCGACGGVCYCGCVQPGDGASASAAISRSASGKLQSAAMSQTEARL